MSLLFTNVMLGNFEFPVTKCGDDDIHHHFQKCLHPACVFFCFDLYVGVTSVTTNGAKIGYRIF